MSTEGPFVGGRRKCVLNVYGRMPAAIPVFASTFMIVVTVAPHPSISLVHSALRRQNHLSPCSPCIVPASLHGCARRFQNVGGSQPKVYTLARPPFPLKSACTSEPPRTTCVPCCTAPKSCKFNRVVFSSCKWHNSLRIDSIPWSPSGRAIPTTRICITRWSCVRRARAALQLTAPLDAHEAYEKHGTCRRGGRRRFPRGSATFY